MEKASIRTILLSTFFVFGSMMSNLSLAGDGYDCTKRAWEAPNCDKLIGYSDCLNEYKKQCLSRTKVKD